MTHVPLSPSEQRINAEIESLYSLMRQHGVTIHNAHQWRPTLRTLGQIHELPTTRGWLIATDGILCLIDREDGSIPFLGHFQWFVADKQETEKGKQRVSSLCQKYDI